ncbi:SWIM zinc finger family protein [Quadrisphaera setariae]|uniref:SWIM zinc finger family protein n=1 Tax=Quadrisphaera setariae TaxID=2593304 RepID=A0A5C8Z469_9ACTN|nr:SWIM zinc finger family protein [Quadrisphaera setariae]TXR52895.1 SWIM zinc finger family protein [Quadrisphaera setariae]
MPQTWSVEQVLALAPDPSSAAAGRKQASPRAWTQTGHRAGQPHGAALWGLCQGSGKTPYQTVVDLSGVDGPAFRCSCPSRKFPCKHALGLLLLWSSGSVQAGEAPDWAATWLTGRAEKAERSATKASAATAAAPPSSVAQDDDGRAAARRGSASAARQHKVAAGVAELDEWLADQVRAGLAGLDAAGYAPFEAVAARMVDAQAPGLATRLRRLPGVVASGEGWPGRLLEELAALRLVTSAHGRLDDLPGPLRASVQRELGQPVSSDDVLASPGTADLWQVLALRDAEEGSLTTRRVWLWGTRAQRPAVVLSFAPRGGALDVSLVPGTAVEAVVHHHPGAAPLRVLVGERTGAPGPLPDWPEGNLAAASAAFAAAVAADPWTTSWPALLSPVQLVPPGTDGAWALQDASGRRARLVHSDDDAPWRALAVTGGRPAAVAVEVEASGVRLLAVRDGQRLVAA